MGGALVKQAEALTEKKGAVKDCLEDIAKNIDDLQYLQNKVEDLRKLLCKPLLGGVKAMHRQECRKRTPTAVELLIMLFTKYEDELLLRSMCFICSELALDRDNALLMREYQISTHLLKVAREYMDDEFIMDDVKRTFANLKATMCAFAREHLRDAIENQSIQSVHLALQLQPHNAELHLEAMETLLELSRDPSIPPQVLETADGGVKPVLIALRKFRKNNTIQAKCLQILSLYAKAASEINGLLGRSGAILLIANNIYDMDEENIDKHLLQQAIWTLNEIAKFKKNKERCIHEGRVGLVLRRAVRILKESDSYAFKDDKQEHVESANEGNSLVMQRGGDNAVRQQEHIETVKENETSNHDMRQHERIETVKEDENPAVVLDQNEKTGWEMEILEKEDEIQRNASSDASKELENKELSKSCIAREKMNAVQKCEQRRQRRLALQESCGGLIIPLKLRKMMRQSEEASESEEELESVFSVSQSNTESNEKNENSGFLVQVDRMGSEAELEEILREFQQLGNKKMREMREKIEAKREQNANRFRAQYM